MSEEKEMTFEEAMKQLEAIVEKLEEGNVPLEEAIAFFQEGMKLSKLCHDKLQHVEKQLEYMLREDGELVPFSPEEA
ncbi:exodeoxyribonuclease VII small subunit [Geobacillus subterraneus]|uniref:Exodeoxyribonuclease 7 small subunit n=2 Tax=Geobacillus TaxID=129337 RepID=A0ABM6A9P3_9BACL|nr:MULTISPECIES: exodeoxyribonuclease VII small subunit [Geobacillus]AMX82946.1 exodeoxyribonuclease VII small subunit [Geobacillus subterraneus]KZS24925.1 exodeoxyribonuclease VII small subunit [Geobacillus subterraneus]OXB91041.1 exodeoxyribonuclease VII small subunit [Geobacillus uzenensis]QIZ68316.1 exodeoxyribonuclease VII small subunit [Geobacillus subterraneus]WPZ17340.1 exodeoxyribonuclease VII small subunit [Geobacillus subterraneus]